MINDSFREFEQNNGASLPSAKTISPLLETYISINLPSQVFIIVYFGFLEDKKTSCFTPGAI